jgi:hypothetical protein
MIDESPAKEHAELQKYALYFGERPSKKAIEE